MQPARGPTILLGGWKADTKKATILTDVEAALLKAGVQDLLDQPPWVPGARHSVSLSEVKLRPEESEGDRASRMQAIISKINDLQATGQKLASGRTLWASVSRQRTERGHGAHASKVRRLMHNVDANFQEIDCVYVSGSVWHKDMLVASVDKPRNGAHVKPGRLEGSWIDLVALAKTTGKPLESWKG